MSDPSEIKILRDEVATIIAENKKLAAVNADLRQSLDQLNITNTELRLDLAEANRRLRYYENPHTPSSANNLPEQKKRSDARRRKTDDSSGNIGVKTGRKKGHQGQSHSRRSSKTIHHTQTDACSRCGSSDLIVKKASQKQICDIEFMPKIETVTHVTYKYKCGCCGKSIDTTPKCITKGTSVGPKLSALAVTLWERGNSLESIKDTFSFFGYNACKATVQHTLDAVSKKMRAEANKINRSLKRTKFFKMDETPLTIKNKLGYVWVGVGDRDVSIKISPTRGAAVITEHYSQCLGKPITTDGYAAYNMFDIRQRCWAHILRESKDAATCPQTQLLHDKLKTLFSDAKLMQKNRNTGAIDVMVHKTLHIAQQYKLFHASFGTTLENAAQNLFTFVRYPGMEPTNNESERMLRKVVIHRKIRQRLVTVGGMQMFGTILTCMLTWRKRGLNLTDKLLDVLGAT